MELYNCPVDDIELHKILDYIISRNYIFRDSVEFKYFDKYVSNKDYKKQMYNWVRSLEIDNEQ